MPGGREFAILFGLRRIAHHRPRQVTDIYGIPNCDTVKRARRWLEEQGVSYRFHDVRTEGLEPHRLSQWLATLGWEKLVNRRSTTWRQLDAADREALSEKTAPALLQAYPTLLRRPVLEHHRGIEVGFHPETYQHIFGGA